MISSIAEVQVFKVAQYSSERAICQPTESSAIFVHCMLHIQDSRMVADGRRSAWLPGKRMTRDDAITCDRISATAVMALQ